MKKIIAILSILLIIFTAGCTVETPIGGERDKHGCLGAAGYTYDENIEACIRNWELNETQVKAAKIAIEYLNPMTSATINNVAVARCPGCFVVNVKLHLNTGDEEVQVNIENWNIVESAPEEDKSGLSPQECEAKGGRTLNIAGGDSCDENELNIGQVVGFISPNICCISREGEKMTKKEAVEIAGTSACVNEGKLTANIMYNNHSNTYWIDLAPKEEKPGCNPACVVSEVTKTAEINWRCTGALPPKE